MNNNGELNADRNLVKQLKLREGQQTEVQANVSATAGKYGCQLN
jgi:hypothetical protein